MGCRTVQWLALAMLLCAIVATAAAAEDPLQKKQCTQKQSLTDPSSCGSGCAVCLGDTPSCVGGACASCRKNGNFDPKKAAGCVNNQDCCSCRCEVKKIAGQEKGICNGNVKANTGDGSCAALGYAEPVFTPKPVVPQAAKP